MPDRRDHARRADDCGRASAEVARHRRSLLPVPDDSQAVDDVRNVVHLPVREHGGNREHRVRRRMVLNSAARLALQREEHVVLDGHTFFAAGASHAQRGDVVSREPVDPRDALGRLTDAEPDVVGDERRVPAELRSPQALVASDRLRQCGSDKAQAVRVAVPEAEQIEARPAPACAAEAAASSRPGTTRRRRCCAVRSPAARPRAQELPASRSATH
jgi:hypothetical protein